MSMLFKFKSTELEIYPSISENERIQKSFSSHYERYDKKLLLLLLQIGREAYFCKCKF